MKSRLKRVLPVLFVLALILGAYWWWKERPAATSGDNSASGTIEATEVTVAAETSGRVVTVTSAEGDAVRAGQELVIFDTALLHAQRHQAEAALAATQGTLAATQANATAAQAQLDQVLAGALTAGAPGRGGSCRRRPGPRRHRPGPARANSRRSSSYGSPTQASGGPFRPGQGGRAR